VTACRQIGQRREPSVRWLDPNFVIHGCANSLFAAKISLLGHRNDLHVRGFPFSEEFVDLSLVAEIAPEGRRFARTLELAGVLSWRFEGYALVPGCHTFLILHGIAETFGLDAELA
jgi:hypothetical protein